MRMLYKYPQRAYPYSDLVAENRRRTRNDPEYELARHRRLRRRPLLRRVRRVREGRARRHPDPDPRDQPRPGARAAVICCPRSGFATTGRGIRARRSRASRSSESDAARARRQGDAPRTATCFASTARRRTKRSSPRTRPTRCGIPGRSARAVFAKDAFDRYVVQGIADAVNPARIGTKAAPLFRRTIGAGETAEIRLRLTAGAAIPAPLGAGIRRDVRAPPARGRRVLPPRDAVRAAGGHAQRAAAGVRGNAVDEAALSLFGASLARRRSRRARRRPRRAGTGAITTGRISRRATSCRCRTSGSTRGSPRGTRRSTCVALAMIDPDFAKDQLLLLMREWYMHPNGQIPAYEWSFGDVNPPVHAWAAIRVYQIEGKMYGRSDRAFLERAFQKLLLNFTWWVNRKDAEGNNIFEGGFLGLDNIGAFDRSSGLPSGGRLEQADGTSWMATYCLNLLGDLARARARGCRLRGPRDEVLRAFRLHRRRGQPRRRPRGRPVARRGRLLLRRAEAARRPLLSDPRATRSRA